MNTGIELFKYFLGSWSITRYLGNNGTATGIARLTQLCQYSIAYREDLKVKVFSFIGDACKEYIYELDGDVLCKKFGDQSLFYRIQLGNGYAIGDHRCGQDDYHAVYTFLGDEIFTLKYEVRGVNKNYDIFTEFTRVPED